MGNTNTFKTSNVGCSRPTPPNETDLFEEANSSNSRLVTDSGSIQGQGRRSESTSLIKGTAKVFGTSPVFSTSPFDTTSSPLGGKESDYLGLKSLLFSTKTLEPNDKHLTSSSRIKVNSSIKLSDNKKQQLGRLENSKSELQLSSENLFKSKSYTLCPTDDHLLSRSSSTRFGLKRTNSRRNLNFGAEITYKLNDNLFARHHEFSESIRSNLRPVKGNQLESLLVNDESSQPISFNCSLVTKFLNTQQAISARLRPETASLVSLRQSKLKFKQGYYKRKVRVKSQATQHKKSSKHLSYSRLSVDSQKSIYKSNLFKSISLVENLRTLSTVSNETFAPRDRPRDIDTPAEVVVRGYVFHRRIATSSFSVIYEASCPSNPHRELACKHIRIAQLANQRDCLRDFVDQELSIMRKVRHPYIIEAYDIITTPTDAYVFMKFADKGIILDYLYKEWRKPLPETAAKRWMEQLMCAVAYIHGLRIVHRDLKLENFLLDEKYTALLSDFGFAVWLDSEQANRLLAVHCGTADYMAPEQHMAASCSNSYYDPLPADIYSMGVCLFEMLNYYRPFAISLSQSSRSLISRQQNRKYEYNKRINLTKECLDLLNQLLEPKPSLRLSATNVLRHAWFRNEIH